MNDRSALQQILLRTPLLLVYVPAGVPSFQGQAGMHAGLPWQNTTALVHATTGDQDKKPANNLRLPFIDIGK